MRLLALGGASLKNAHPLKSIIGELVSHPEVLMKVLMGDIGHTPCYQVSYTNWGCGRGCWNCSFHWVYDILSFYEGGVEAEIVQEEMYRYDFEGRQERRKYTEVRELGDYMQFLRRFSNIKSYYNIVVENNGIAFIGSQQATFVNTISLFQ